MWGFGFSGGRKIVLCGLVGWWVFCLSRNSRPSEKILHLHSAVWFASVGGEVRHSRDDAKSEVRAEGESDRGEFVQHFRLIAGA
jgi:hypothetical protein